MEKPRGNTSGRSTPQASDENASPSNSSSQSQQSSDLIGAVGGQPLVQNQQQNYQTPQKPKWNLTSAWTQPDDSPYHPLEHKLGPLGTLYSLHSLGLESYERPDHLFRQTPSPGQHSDSIRLPERYRRHLPQQQPTGADYLQQYYTEHRDSPGPQVDPAEDARRTQVLQGMLDEAQYINASDTRDNVSWDPADYRHARRYYEYEDPSPPRFIGMEMQLHGRQAVSPITKLSDGSTVKVLDGPNPRGLHYVIRIDPTKPGGPSLPGEVPFHVDLTGASTHHAQLNKHNLNARPPPPL